MTRNRTLQWVARLAFVLLIAACITPLVIRSLLPEMEPSIEIVDVGGGIRTIALSEMKKMPVLTREGSYQNQYGNWRDQGTYSGVLLADLIGDRIYTSLDVMAEDGYRVTVDRSRVEGFDYPMILAFGVDEIEVPDWEDGFRVAVLPEDGGVSNADYGVESAGSYWVRRVLRLILHP
jgi:hypothetical protein